MFTDEQVEAAVRALSDPERFAGAERRVAALAPQLQRILTHALNEGGWFGEAHESQLRQALAEPDQGERADPVRRCSPRRPGWGCWSAWRWAGSSPVSSMTNRTDRRETEPWTSASWGTPASS